MKEIETSDVTKVSFVNGIMICNRHDPHPIVHLGNGEFCDSQGHATETEIVTPFYATLAFIGDHSRDHSVYFGDKMTQRYYVMDRQECYALIKKTTVMRHGVISGWWHFYKPTTQRMSIRFTTSDPDWEPSAVE